MLPPRLKLTNSLVAFTCHSGNAFHFRRTRMCRTAEFVMQNTSKKNSIGLIVSYSGAGRAGTKVTSLCLISPPSTLENLKNSKNCGRLTVDATLKAVVERVLSESQSGSVTRKST